MTTEFAPGEKIRITLEGTVKRMGSPGFVVLRVGGMVEAVPHTGDGITVDRIDPEGWPPRPGDLWRDRDGRPWFVIENHHGNPVMNGLYGDRHGHEYVQQEHGPLHLVHREEDR